MAALVSAVLLGVFVGALAVAVFGAGRYYQHYRRDRYDATTTGAVVANEPADPASPDLEADGGLPEVAYEYAVDEETYQNDRLRATTGPLSAYGFETLLGELAVGDQVRVHYDSESPAESVLVPPESGRGLAVLAVTAFVVAVLALLGILI